MMRDLSINLGALLVIISTPAAAQQMRGGISRHSSSPSQTRLAASRENLLREHGVPAEEFNAWKVLGVHSDRVGQCSEFLNDYNIMCTSVVAHDDPWLILPQLDGIESSLLTPKFLEHLQPLTVIIEELPYENRDNNDENEPPFYEPTFLGMSLRNTQMNHVGVLPSGTVEEAALHFLRLKDEGTVRCRDWEQQTGFSYVLYNILCPVYRGDASTPHAFYW